MNTKTDENAEELQLEEWRERLAEEIFKRGIKITELSVAVGQNRDYIARVIKTKKGNPSPALFLKICNEIGVSAGYILEGTKASSTKEGLAEAIMGADDQTVDQVSDIQKKLTEGALKLTSD